MYITKRTFITAEMRISDIVRENPSILLLLEHFGINETLNENTVKDICHVHGLGVNAFLTVCNLYNGFPLKGFGELGISDIPCIISYLRNSHIYYRNEKYPEITGHIKVLRETDRSLETDLIERFFDDYFSEVMEHLEYEEKTAFPYFSSFSSSSLSPGKLNFSASAYLEHHTDIESKLEDLLTLLMKHLHIKSQASVKRKLLHSLFELDFDLKVHSLIEEKILIPIVIKAEKLSSDAG